MNIQLFDQVVEKIKADPGHLNMDEWHMEVRDHGAPVALGGIRVVTDDYASNACGTVCCIAGWACEIAAANSGKLLAEIVRENNPNARKHVVADDLREAARNLLGLSEIAAAMLFDVNEWPICFSSRFDRERAGTPEYASVTLARLNCFRRDDNERLATKLYPKPYQFGKWQAPRLSCKSVRILVDTPRRSHSIDGLERIDDDGDYCPENCRWEEASIPTCSNQAKAKGLKAKKS